MKSALGAKENDIEKLKEKLQQEMTSCEQQIHEIGDVIKRFLIDVVKQKRFDYLEEQKKERLALEVALQTSQNELQKTAQTLKESQVC